MKRLIWNVRVAVIFKRWAGLPLRYGWQLARGDNDSFNEGLSPAEVFDTEVSYWDRPMTTKGWLERVNEKGVPGIYECRPTCGADMPQDDRIMGAIEGCEGAP